MKKEILDFIHYGLKTVDLANLNREHLVNCFEELEKGNADLEEKLANADYQLEGRDLEIKELKAQIEKMKLCQNCKFEDNDYLAKPCCDCTRCLGDIKRNGNSDKWEIKENGI